MRALSLGIAIAATLGGLLLAAAAGAVPGRGIDLSVTDAAGHEVMLYRQSHALVVGVSDYTAGWPDLPGVREDVAAVAVALEAQGFRVTTVLDPTHAQLTAAYRDFINRYGGPPDNRLLLYFAGHGHTLKRAWGGEMGYVVPADAPNPEQDPAGFKAKALDMQLMEVYARRIDAKHALFVFDSCFSGSLFALSRAVPAVIGYKTARPVRQFITSGTADETVPDQSVFRRQFVAALAGKADGNGDGYVTGAELGEYLQDRVTNYTYNAQHPQYGKIRDPLLDEGDFVFRVAKAASPPSPAPPPPPPLTVARVGGVQVNVNVADAAVSIAGEPAGQAAPGRPVNRWAVPAGETEVTVSAPGYLATRRRVTVEAGKWVQVQVDLERAAPPPVTLTVRSNVYGDRVLVDGRPHGPTPLNLRLAPGEHSVRVEKDGYEPFEKRVMLYADKTIMASLNRQIQAAPTAAAPPPTPQPTAAGPSRGTWREPETDMELLWVPAGCYTMGYEDSAHLPAHTVCVKGFWMGKYEVTVTQFKRFVQATDYAGQGRNGWYCGRGMAQPSRPQQEGDHPVLCVSWHEAQAMAQWLSQRHGSPGRFRLPTEAEWEYACRSGGRAELYSGGQDVDRVAWYKHNSGGATHSVGTRTPNGLGLHDLSGNAREWVMDSDVGDGYRRHTRDDPVIISDRVKAKVMRGGSWANPASRATCRRSWSENQDLRSALNGFRLVRTP